ncbi:hypothetical protein FACS1894219_08280 [Clostridia bacterium]|nr:hypothetical protein FACS1894219_08280 [Clostridia bacterium]
MNAINVSVDTNNYDSITSAYQLSDIGERVSGSTKSYDRNNIKDFAKRVSTIGRAFSPATYKGIKQEWADVDGSVTPDNFEQQQLLTLQFDNDISFDEVKRRAECYDLPILFAYNSIPVGGRKPFRAVWLNDAPITDMRTADAMQGALKVIFPEAKQDSCYKDIVRLCPGGTSMLHFAEDIPEIDAESLFRNMSLYLRDKHGKTNYKRAITKFSELSGIKLNNNNQLDITIVDVKNEKAEITKNNFENDNFSPISTMYKNNFGEKLSNRSYKFNYKSSTDDTGSAKVESIIHKPYRSDTLNNLNSSCNLYQDFCSGERKLSSTELMGLATNLCQVEGGRTKFKQNLSENQYYDTAPEKYDNWDFNLSYIKHYTPYICDSFCPYRDTCSHGDTILSSAKPKYHQVERLANYAPSYVPLQDAEADFARCFNETAGNGGDGWHVIKAQTALGKTETYLNYIAQTSQWVLVAVPTNKLKHEIEERGKAKGIEFTISPSLRELENELDSDVWSDIKERLDFGRPTMPLIKKLIKENHPDSKILKHYLKELDEFNHCSGHAVTTHRRLTTMDVSNYDLVIVDEDIIFSTIVTSKSDISVSDLKKLHHKLKKTAPGSKPEAKVREMLRLLKTEDYFTLPSIDKTDAKVDISMAVDTSALCSATHFCCHKESENNHNEKYVSYMTPVEFSPNAKYVMVSATVDEEICGLCFGEDNVNFYECNEAEYKGDLYQFCDKPMSRAHIRQNPDVINKIKSWSGFKETITFKFLNLGDPYLGNTAGRDTLKGKDIDVVGTPHQPEWIYKLFAYSLGVQFDTDKGLQANSTVTHNGCRFRFTTFNNEKLRAIQFYLLESELEQAVGRARLLRCDCTVNLFSNFPLRHSILKASEYDVPSD